MNYLEECHNMFVYICNSRFPVNSTIDFVYTKALISTLKPSFPSKKLYFSISYTHPQKLYFVSTFNKQ